MDLFTHAVTKGSIDTLMTCNPARAFELSRDDRRKEMAPVALDVDKIANQPLRDKGVHVGGCGIGHAPILASAGTAGPAARRRQKLFFQPTVIPCGNTPTESESERAWV